MDASREKLISVLKDKRLTGLGLRIVLLMYASLEYGVYTPLTPPRVSRVLELHESSVKRSLKDLVEKGVVKKRYESGKLVGYEIL